MNKCEICKCNKICDHNLFGFEICNNFIPEDVVEVKHGEWVKNGKTRTCSCCGYFYINVDMEDDNYCPNCGAKMDGERKEK